MFRITSTLRTSAALAAAMFFAQVLSACSGATSSLPGGGLTPASTQIASLSNAAHSMHQIQNHMPPPNCNGCNACPPGYSYGTFWQEWTSTNPPTWAEFTGDYYMGWLDGKYEALACGTWKEDVACNPASWSNCPPINYWWNQISALPMANLRNTFVLSLAPSSQVQVVHSVSAKKGFEVLSTLSTEGATPVSVAGDHNGSIYASVFTKGSSVQPAVYVYQPGATTPSSTLTDANANGDNPAGVAVDRRDDVFFAYDTTSGSSQAIQIDEFPAGKNAPQPFATIPGSGGGALAVTTKGEIVATSPSEGMVYVFASNGKPVTKFAVSGSPTSIGLDRRDANLTITDGTNNAISVYSFPSGALVSTGPFETKDGTTVIPASVLPKDPQLP